MKTLVTGCSGLVGNALIEYLFNKGHSIQCLRRNSADLHGSFWLTESLEKPVDSEINTVIHLAGENVAGGRWTTRKKRLILNSRVDGTRELVDSISLMETKPKIFLCASAVGYYGSRGDEIVDESSSSGKGFLAQVCRQWERETDRLTAMGVRVVNLRFGMVLSPKGGALHKMIPPFKAGIGGVVGSGNQYVSWISIRDLVEIIGFIIKNETINGPVNVVSPTPATNRILTKSLGRALNRPTFLPIPAFIAKTVFGEMADEMLLASTRAIPGLLKQAGYMFKDSSLDATLRFCTRPSPPD
jgi:uncharacterized protein (TIGR01777 family)